MKVPFSPPDITEKEIQYVTEVLQSGWITTGPTVKEFEKKICEFIGTERCVALGSATAALEGAARLFGIGEGDEVIVPAYTYTSTASAFCHTGATIRFIDCREDGFEPDWSKLAEMINEHTKAVVPVDLGGMVCDYDAIFAAVEAKKNLFKPESPLQEALGRVAVIADSAHAFGSKRDGVNVGCLADFTAFSFHAVKNLTTAEGGALTWKPNPKFDNDVLYQELQLYSLHGQSKDALTKLKAGSWEYDIIYPAYKCNMTNINAAIGLAQLERYDSMLARRRELNENYTKAFREVGLEVLPHYENGMESTGHLFLVRIPGAKEADRNAVIDDMAARDIACNVHYKPLPMMTAYKKMGYDIKDFPNAFKHYENLISIPVFSKMTDEQNAYVIENFLDVLKQRGLI